MDDFVLSSVVSRSSVSSLSMSQYGGEAAELYLKKVRRAGKQKQIRVKSYICNLTLARGKGNIIMSIWQDY